MGIVYALVTQGSVVLAEFTATSTDNASSMARQILEKITGTNDDTNVSYSQDGYIFYVKRTNGLTVLCMADDSAGPGRRIAFAFLGDIHHRFVTTYAEGVFSAEDAYAMNDEFSIVLSQQMEYYSNEYPNADTINQLKGEMSQVMNVMGEIIDKVLERSELPELLVDNTATMQEHALRFRNQARRARRNRFCCCWLS